MADIWTRRDGTVGIDMMEDGGPFMVLSEAQYKALRVAILAYQASLEGK